MMSYQHISDTLRAASAGSEELDQLIWSRIYGCDFPLTPFDKDTFYEYRAEGLASASMSSNAQMALAMLEDTHPGACIKVQTHGGKIAVKTWVSDFDFGGPVTGNFTGTLPFSQMALAISASFTEMQGKYIKIEQENLAVFGVKDRIERANQWPVEETAPNQFRCVHHGERLATGPYFSAGKAREYGAILHHSDHNMVKHRNRYIELGLAPADSTPSP
jgi:hypothetical protein